jgi:hypothetical protein
MSSFHFLVANPKLSVKPYNRREASLVFNEKAFKGFPLNDKSDFEKIRVNTDCGYFDRTRYISVVDSYGKDVLLFLRPRRFSKSLFLFILARFHGVENKHNYKALFQVSSSCSIGIFSFFILWIY